MAAPRKYSDEYRDAIHRLVNENGETAADVARKIAAGLDDLPPADIPQSTVAELARKARGHIPSRVQDLGKAEALDALSRRALGLTDRQIARYEQASDVDPDDILTLFKALKEAQSLVSQKAPGEKDKAEPSGLLGGMAGSSTTARQGNNGHSGAHPVSAPVAPE